MILYFIFNWNQKKAAQATVSGLWRVFSCFFFAVVIIFPFFKMNKDYWSTELKHLL